MIKRNPLYLVLAMAVLLLSLPIFISCGKDDDDDDSTYSYSTSTQTTLVTGFSLQADANVLASLDSVHFTVDFDRGMIYNADSLPVGTDISALKVTVEFLNTVKSAVFSITGATVQADTTINYTTSMTKSLDFTGKVLLTVTSSDETQVKEYDIKVLVHKINPDSLAWPMSWRRDLPGYDGNAIAQKTVKQGDLYRTLVYDGMSCSMMTATAPNQGTWARQTLSLPFTPDVSSLVASDEAMYMMADDGVLYSSTDGIEWDLCGVTWHSVLGVYDNRVLGILAGSDGYYHDEYPRSDGFASSLVEEGFPVAHTSDMVVTGNTWTISQQAIIVGGIDSEGKLVNDVWGYDGNCWGKINNVHNTSLPAVADATLFSYYTYRSLSGVRRYGLQQTWYLMGGKLADGVLNDKIYLSSTQGITWSVGDSTVTQPSHIPSFYGAQAFVNTETLTAGANYAPRRIQSFDGTWECPFIYLFGGYNSQGELLPNVWRGVYIRMTNYPVF